MFYRNVGLLSTTTWGCNPEDKNSSSLHIFRHIISLPNNVWNKRSSLRIQSADNMHLAICLQCITDAQLDSRQRHQMCWLQFSSLSSVPLSEWRRKLRPLPSTPDPIHVSNNDNQRYWQSSVGPWPVGRTPWTADQPVARPLPKHRTTQSYDKSTLTSKPYTARPPWSAGSVYTNHEQKQSPPHTKPEMWRGDILQ
jgi:hypothetical protein